MFRKLKKKIEDEVRVGDLVQLASPLAAAFGGDRRVGGSTQGTNSPNNIGSRQSSLASLVDIHHDEPTSPSPNTNNNLTVPSPSPSPSSITTGANKTSNSAAAAISRQKSQEFAQLEAELKKIKIQFDAMKKSYEDIIQNQEADFAWKYSAKEEELEKLRAENKKLEELLKTMEGSHNQKPNYTTSAFDPPKPQEKQKHNLNDIFGEFLKSEGFNVSSNCKNQTIQQIRKQEMVNSGILEDSKSGMDPISIKVNGWKEGKTKNIRALLSSLHTITWPECNWQEVSMAEIVSVASVKKSYRKACLAIHPDKLVGSKHEELAKQIFMELNEAWNAFEEIK